MRRRARAALLLSWKSQLMLKVFEADVLPAGDLRLTFADGVYFIGERVFGRWKSAD